jgi:phosphate transport system substrate-binding protein
MQPQVYKRIIKLLLPILTIGIFIIPSKGSPEEVLKIGGTGSAIGSMKLLASAFQKNDRAVEVEILPSLGSTGGIKAVSRGAIDIGISGRPFKDEELKLGLWVTEYAKTPLVLVTGNDVNISNLSTEEVIKIYRGKIQTWPDGQRMRLILRPVHEADNLLIKQISPEMSEAVDEALSRHGMLVAITDQENLNLIEKIPGALAFSTLAQIISEKRSVKILSFNGVNPSIKTLAEGSYSLLKAFLIVTKKEPSMATQRFIEFIHSPNGRKILEESGNWSGPGKIRE